jgi:hypothetical protein
MFDIQNIHIALDADKLAIYQSCCFVVFGKYFLHADHSGGAV